MSLIFLLYAIAIGTLNMGAGRRFWGLTGSSQVGRILFAVGTAGLATIVALGDIWLFLGLAVLLFLWRLPSWGEFFPAIHGREEAHEYGVFAMIAHKIWPIAPSTPMERKLKATLGMALRMSLIVPAALFYAYMVDGAWFNALAFPLMGIAYFIGGLPNEHKYSVAVAEFICGVIIAAILWSF